MACEPDRPVGKSNGDLLYLGQVQALDLGSSSRTMHSRWTLEKTITKLKEDELAGVAKLKAVSRMLNPTPKPKAPIG